MIFKIYNEQFWKKFPIKYTKKNNKITIDNVKLLDDAILPYQECQKLFSNISNQLLTLEQNKWELPFFSLHDIYIHQNKIYFFPDNNLLSKNLSTDFKSTKNIHNVFLSPEIINTSKNTNRSAWYSLGTLTSFFLTGIKEFSIENLKPFHGTKLYWAILRCIHTNPKDRSLLII